MSEDNVIKFPGVDYINDIDQDALEEFFGKKVNVEKIIDGLAERDFDDLIVIGRYNDADGIYFASSTGNPEKITWDLERAKTLIALQYFQDTEDLVID